MPNPLEASSSQNPSPASAPLSTPMKWLIGITIVSSVAGVALLVVGGLSELGPIGSPGFISSIAGGGALSLIPIGSMIYILIALRRKSSVDVRTYIVHPETINPSESGSKAPTTVQETQLDLTGQNLKDQVIELAGKLYCAYMRIVQGEEIELDYIATNGMMCKLLCPFHPRSLITAAAKIFLRQHYETASMPIDIYIAIVLRNGFDSGTGRELFRLARSAKEALPHSDAIPSIDRLAISLFEDTINHHTSKYEPKVGSLRVPIAMIKETLPTVELFKDAVRKYIEQHQKKS